MASTMLHEREVLQHSVANRGSHANSTVQAASNNI